MAEVKIQTTEKVISRKLKRVTEKMHVGIVTVVKRAAIWIENDALANVMGRVLTTRTGRLARSIHHITFSLPKGGYEAIIGTDVKYGKTHEYGAHITPKTAKALAIPTEHALTGDGAPRYVGPLRQYNFRYLPAKVTGKFPMLAEPQEGGKILFVLVGAVDIPKRPWLRPAKKKNVRRISAALNQVLGRAVRGQG